jgi:hypothetical protein
MASKTTPPAFWVHKQTGKIVRDTYYLCHDDNGKWDPRIRYQYYEYVREDRVEDKRFDWHEYERELKRIVLKACLVLNQPLAPRKYLIKALQCIQEAAR